MSNNKEPTPHTSTTEHEEEEPLILFNNEDVEEGLQNYNNSLVEKLLSDKNINISWIQSIMHNIWKKLQKMRIVELKPKLYQFFFHNEADLEKILKGNPWSFRNSWLVLKKWDRKEELEGEGLDQEDINVQIWNLPEHWTNRSKNMDPWLKADSLGTKLNKGKMQNKSDTEEKKGRNALNLKKLEEKMLEGLAKLTMAEGNDIEGGTGSPAERGSITPTKLQETKGAQELNLTQNHKGTQEEEEPDRMIVGLEDIITGDSVETKEKDKQGKEENKEKGMSKYLKDSTNTMSTPTKVGTKM
ncbi:hypothetical protein Ahy_B05g074368 [Arachis hypogaea]|uniref:DUF4283 domain-containing protein n=1 Tax=Arachis hypogaea TaxID=3818 RepID=A0A444YYN9_ARAHY|nr:hypothetical protein Ahy_B05g074368 [Arachis hypogaea]